MLRQAQAQRKAIEQVTGIEVEPLLVFSRAWVDRPQARRKGVRVLPARMLVGHLAKRQATLSQEQVEQASARLASALREQASAERALRGRRVTRAS